jgi:hypothetical protein
MLFKRLACSWVRLLTPATGHKSTVNPLKCRKRNLRTKFSNLGRF